MVSAKCNALTIIAIEWAWLNSGEKSWGWGRGRAVSGLRSDNLHLESSTLTAQPWASYLLILGVIVSNNYYESFE